MTTPPVLSEDTTDEPDDTTEVAEKAEKAETEVPAPRRLVDATMPNDPTNGVTASVGRWGATVHLGKQTLIYLLGALGLGAAGVAGGGGAAGAWGVDVASIVERLDTFERNQVLICEALEVDCEGDP